MANTLRSLVTHSLVAMTSASQELSAVCFCRMDFQAIGPPLRYMIYPESERNLNNSIGVPSGTEFPIWPPQQASLNAVSYIGVVAASCVVELAASCVEG
jgi:hypothetical protein